ncbi:MAG: hypothetical protein COA96_15715 [SAR86 cluster bacterium]|uniref:Uncharacterized protein n=1 Tax=SAR86 cluster bacterium TaxID=2030880 RepID=A0A2A5ANF8_9GAMM|nr:MAG: hypothetical protein COA96_15715 [SAR86 cluster bacterium]
MGRMNKREPKFRNLNVIINVTGMSPLLLDFLPSRKSTSNRLRLNLSHVKKVDSIGLSVLLGVLFVGKRPSDEFVIDLVPSKTESVNEKLNMLEISPLLAMLNSRTGPAGHSKDLFRTEFSNNQTGTCPSSTPSCQKNFEKVHLFIPHAHANRQEALIAFSNQLKSTFQLDSPRSFNHEHMITILIELAKNTLDHSNGIGILGIRIHSGAMNNRKIRITYCDTGEGICLHVRKFLSSNNASALNISEQRLVKKGSAIDFLQKAFTAGFSSKGGNKTNYGMGLTLVTQGAFGCGFEVWLRDANSIIDLSGMKNSHTHTDMREASSATTAAKVLLFNFEKEIVNERQL